MNFDYTILKSPLAYAFCAFGTFAFLIWSVVGVIRLMCWLTNDPLKKEAHDAK